MSKLRKSEMVEDMNLVEPIPSPKAGKGRSVVADRRQVYFSDLMTREFKREIRHLNTFVYGKVGLFESLLSQVFGKFWQDGRWSKLVREVRHLERLEDLKKTLILIPAVQDEEEFNRLVAKAVSLGKPIWLVGYPSTVHKHLWANFSCFILAPAPESELRILRDVVGLTSTDLEVLNLESRAAIKGLAVTPDETIYIKGYLVSR